VSHSADLDARKPVDPITFGVWYFDLILAGFLFMYALN